MPSVITSQSTNLGQEVPSAKRIEGLSKNILDAQALRIAAIAEIKAINLYEELAEIVNDEGVSKVLIDVAREEKTHVGEFNQALSTVDKEHGESFASGVAEAKGIAENG